MQDRMTRLRAEFTSLQQDQQTEKLQDFLRALHPSDIADLLEPQPPRRLVALFQLLEPPQAAQVLDKLGKEATRRLLKRLPTTDTAALLNLLPVDDAVELLTEDVPHLRATLLNAMDRERAAEIETLLNYPPESVGLLMTQQFPRLRASMTRDDVVQYLRTASYDTSQTSILFVLDPDNRLIGAVSLLDIFTSTDTSSVKSLMTTDVVSVTPETDQEEVARLAEQHDLPLLPVVDAQGVLLGILTIDDLIDVLVEENTQDMLRLGGVFDGTDQPYFTVPLLSVLWNRLGWLLLLLVADTFTGTVMRGFEEQLAAMTVLSFYIPLLIGTGGNTGSQTVSTIIRGIAVRDIRFRDLFRVLQRELLAGLLLGVGLGGVAALRAWSWDGDPALALVIFLSIVVICTWANIMGALIPLVATKLGGDPAVVSAPLITSVVDTTGLFIYLSIATLILLS